MTRQNQILAGVLAAVVAAAGFYFGVLKPKNEEAARLKTDVAAAQKTLDDARATLANYQKAKTNYKQAYQSVIRLGKAVPADDDVRSLMVQIDSAAKQTHVDFRGISVGGSTGGAPATAAQAAASLPPGAQVGAAGFPAMPFNFTFGGQFFRLGDFFSELEKFVSVNNKRVDVTGRLMTVDSVTLEPDANGFPNIKATVGATSFLVSPEQGLTAGATAQGPAGTTAQPGAAAQPQGGSSTVPSTTATSTGAIR
jgi:hypothetical protein